MTRQEAIEILELDDNVDQQMLREQFRWFVKFYHPDNKETGDVVEFKKIMEAYRFLNNR